MALDRRQQPGHLVAEGHGNGLLQVAAADHRRQAMCLRVLGHRRRDRRKFAIDDRQAFADLQHRGGVGDVLRGRAPVAVFAELVAAQRVELRHHAEDRVADALGLLAQLDHVDLVEPAVADDLVGGLLRNQAQAALHLGQRGFDVEVLLRAVLVGPDVAHLVAGEDALEDGGVDDGGGHGEFPLGDRSEVRCRRAAKCVAPAAPRGDRSCGRRAGRRRVTRPRRPARAAPSRAPATLGARAAWTDATWRGWMHSLAPKPWRRDQARSASRRCSSSSCGVTPATGVARPATREAMASALAACTSASELSAMSRSRSSA